jgi:hypothetical protein
MSDEKPREEPADAPPSDAPAPDAASDTAPPVTADTDATSGEAATAGEAATSGKKRKRKRKKPEEPELRESLGPDGRERPAFLLGFPKDPELERVMRAFELGNYAFVRKEAPLLAEKTSEPNVRAAAEELARRIEPDPLMKVLLGLAVALFAVITFWAYKTHGG